MKTKHNPTECPICSHGGHHLEFNSLDWMLLAFAVGLIIYQLWGGPYDVCVGVDGGDLINCSD